MRLSGFIFALIYLGIGAFWHAIFVDTAFIVNDLWSYVWLFAWPVPLGVFGFLAGLALMLLLIVIIGIWAYVEGLFAERRQRRMRRAFENVRRSFEPKI